MTTGKTLVLTSWIFVGNVMSLFFSMLSLLLTWGQTMVEAMKITVNSFKRSHKGTATLSAPKPAAGHCQPKPLPETSEHSWISLGQSLVGSLLLSPAFWCTQCSLYALQESVSYCCGQESLRRNGVAIIVNKRVQNAMLGCNLKNNRMISSFPR